MSVIDMMYIIHTKNDKNMGESTLNAQKILEIKIMDIVVEREHAQVACKNLPSPS